MTPPPLRVRFPPLNRELSMIKAVHSIVIIAAFSLLTATAWGEDWPQWRGPKRDGISQETGLLQHWPSDGPKLLWQVKDLGGGYSTPAVVGEHPYMISNKGTADEYVESRSIADGKQV